MGMFDKDKEYGLRLDQAFDLKEHFIVWDARIAEETIATDLGQAEVALLVASKMDDPGEKIEYNTVASAIVSKAKEAEESDFPAVCSLLKVASKKWGREALVLQFVKEYD